MGTTKIEWADRVWNPVVGCTPVSEGCRNCYAKRLHDMRHKAFLDGKKMPEQYAQPFEQVQMLTERLEDPLHWRTPQRIFVNSMSDLFHPDVPYDFIGDVFETISYCPQHTILVLTKRPERVFKIFNEIMLALKERPLPNLWLGVSVEDQKTADERIPWLMKTPAAVRFVSVEPMLGEVELSYYLPSAIIKVRPGMTNITMRSPALDWIICGGESGSGARPMDPDWARSLRDQCVAAGVPFFFKGWGEWAFEGIDQDDPRNIVFAKNKNKHRNRLLDGREWNEFPEMGTACCAPTTNAEVK